MLVHVRKTTIVTIDRQRDHTGCEASTVAVCGPRTAPSGLRRLGGIPLRNLAGKICGLLRANELDCAPRVGKLDGFLGLRAGHPRVGNCGRGYSLASEPQPGLAVGANSISARRQGRPFAALARGHVQRADRPCVRPGRGYPSRSAPWRRRASAPWLARTPRAAGPGRRRWPYLL